tara:strand:- start:68653 stop:69060 length:408 start_codon:yes stop_codon:yes gene_type:complete
VLCNGRLVDDRTVKGDTLGERRLRTPLKKKRISTYTADIISLIKGTQATETWYIDYYGDIFCYRKTRTERVICHRISKVTPMDTYSVVALEGIDFPVILPRPPTGGFAQVLYLGIHPWKILNIVPSRVKSTVKKV